MSQKPQLAWAVVATNGYIWLDTVRPLRRDVVRYFDGYRHPVAGVAPQARPPHRPRRHLGRPTNTSG